MITAKPDVIAALAHFEILIRPPVKVRRSVEVLDHVRRARTRERLRHPDMRVRRGQLAMTLRTETVSDIAGRQRENRGEDEPHVISCAVAQLRGEPRNRETA